MKLKCDILLSACAFKFNLRRYSTGTTAFRRDGGAGDGGLQLPRKIVGVVGARHVPGVTTLWRSGALNTPESRQLYDDALLQTPKVGSTVFSLGL